jgi:Mg2+ and Co2+ transporter CorA
MTATMILPVALIIGLFGLKMATNPASRRMGVVLMLVGGAIIVGFLVLLGLSIGNMG